MEEKNQNESITETVYFQSRNKSPLFWVGLVGCVYEAVVHSFATAGIEIPVWVSAIGVGISAILIYCNGNNPSLSKY